MVTLIRTEKELNWIDRKAQSFKRILEGTFDAHCTSGLYKLEFHPLYHMDEDMRRLIRLVFRQQYF